jgi:hypothetical protein
MVTLPGFLYIVIRYNYQAVESLQSHFILTMSHWSSGLPVCFPSKGTRVQIPWEVLMWNWDSPVCVVSLNWWPRHDWSFVASLKRASFWTITRPSCDNVIIPLDLTHLSCPGFTLTAGLPSGFATTESLLGESPVESLQSHFISPCLTSPVDYLFTSRHKGPGFKSPGGTYVKPGFSC